MSRLSYEGDLNKNFGEYFPTPYIDQVEVLDWTSPSGVAGYEFNVEVSFLFTVPEYDPAQPNKDKRFIKEILDRINLNLIFTKSKDNYFPVDPSLLHDYIPGEDYGDTRSAAMRHEKVTARLLEYKQLTGVDYSKAEDPMDELSLLLYDPSILPIFIKSEAPSYTDDGTIASVHLDINEISLGLGYDLIPVSTEDFVTALNAGQFVEIYDKTGRKFLKIIVGVNHKLLIARYAGTYYEGEFLEDEDVSAYKVVEDGNINLLAFSCMLTKEEILDSTLRTNSAMKLMFSDVAYENIMQGGSIANQTEESYFDDNEDIYIETPLQALNGSYHKADTTNHQDIYDKFTELIQRYISIIPGGPEDAESNDPELIGSIDVIQYNLQTYKDSVDLLKRIDNARKMIINRSSGTRTGALFNDMAMILGRVNDVVNRGTPLTKKLTVNAKVLDARGRLLGDVSLPGPVGVSHDSLFLFKQGRTVTWANENTTRFKISDYVDRSDFAGLGIEDLTGAEGADRTVITEGSAVGDVKIRYTADGYIKLTWTDPRTGATMEETLTQYQGIFEDVYGAREEYNVTFGYMAFDWRTALTNNSVLSTLVNVSRFIKYFGIELVQRYYIPHKYIIEKAFPIAVVDGSSPEPAGSPETALTFSKELTVASTEDKPIPTYDPSSHHGRVDRDTSYSLVANPEEFVNSDGSIVKHYATERNVSVLLEHFDQSPSIQAKLDHKVFYVEFQNIDQMATLMDHDQATLDQYRGTFEIWDYTKTALVDLIKHYYWLHLALKQYLEDASLACSYNKIDGVFNDFFAESMQREFITNPAGAPWIFCAVAYIKHVDFLSNKYNGDQTQMILAAREIIQRISPQTGTLGQLKAFYENFIGLYVSYYSPSSRIGQELSLLGPHDDSEDDYAIHHGVHRTFTSNWRSEVRYSNQNESNRDNFLDNITRARQEYERASEAYAELIGETVINSKAQMRDLFDDRQAKLEEKVDYEIGLLSWGGYGADSPPGSGCKYAWWWDGWRTPVPFGDYTRPPAGTDPYGSTAGENEFGKIYPEEYDDLFYGYVIVDPMGQDKIVDFYRVSEFGEPTVFMNFRKDEEHSTGPSRCRYVKRAYRCRESDFRYDDRHGVYVGASAGSEGHITTSLGDNKFGGYYGDATKPTQFHEYSYTSYEASDREALRELILAEYQGEGGEAYYRRRIPNFEIIWYYDTYEDWLAAAEAGTVNLDYDGTSPYENVGSSQFTVYGGMGD